MILVLCPLKIELKQLLKALSSAGLVFRSDHGTHHGEDLILSVGGHGKVNFALNAYSLILKHKPSLLICAGTAGNLDGLKPLEVIAATKTVEHDYNLKFIKKDR